MRKKLLFFLLALGGGAYFLWIKPFAPASFEGPCPFCNPQILSIQTVYEEDQVLALCTHKPIFPGHCLIIPKRHVERFEQLTEEEISQIGNMIKKVHQSVSQTFGTSPYLLLQKNGREVGQSVPHLHFHYIPRKEGEFSTFQFFFHFYLANLKPPLSPEETKEIADRLRYESIKF